MAEAIVPRPKIVAIVAGFLFAAALIAIVVGTSVLFRNGLMDRLWELNPSGAPAFHALGGLSGAPLLALGVATLVAAQALLRAKRWAWWFAVGLFAVNVCGHVAAYFVTQDAMRSACGVIIAAIFLYLLVRPQVRAYFRNS
jgi:formate/nitrite transporter FocA (FNT family)